MRAATTKRPIPRRFRTAEIPFEIRERQNIARVLRRTRLANFVGTVMIVVMMASALYALASVARLSADPNYIRPW